MHHATRVLVAALFAACCLLSQAFAQSDYIQLIGENPIYLALGQPFSDPGAQLVRYSPNPYDPFGPPSGPFYETIGGSGYVNTFSPGTYTITYDGSSYGSSAYATRSVIVTGSVSANLIWLSLEDPSTSAVIGLSPGFQSGTTEYTASVAYAVSQVRVSAMQEASGASVVISVNGMPNYGSTSAYLNEGANTITVEVRAQDGVTTKTYRVTVTRSGPWQYELNASNEAILTYYDGPASSFSIPASVGGSGTTYPVVQIGNGNPVASLPYDPYTVPNVTLPNGVRIIADRAFSGMSALTQVTMPGSLLSIGESAFFGSGLQSVSIPNSVTNVGSAAFYSCPNLRSVSIGRGVTNVEAVVGRYSDMAALAQANPRFEVDGNNPFYSSQSGQLLNKDGTILLRYPSEGFGQATAPQIPRTVTKIGRESFYSYGPGSIVIPNSVTTIEDSAFSGLENVFVNGSVTNIGNYAFSGYYAYGYRLAVYLLGDAPSALGTNWISFSDADIKTMPGTTGHTNYASTTVGANANANLQSLGVIGSSLSPAFTVGQTVYTASVPGETGAVRVRATPETSVASVSQIFINGAAVVPGQLLPVDVGPNRIDVDVSAPGDERTNAWGYVSIVPVTKTYTIWATRAVPSTPITNADLYALTASGAAMSPAFSPATTAYTAVVSNTVYSISFTPTVADGAARVQMRINGGAYTALPSGMPRSVSLALGTTLIELMVTAPDGATTKTYSLTVTRPPALSWLSVSSGVLSPAFNANTNAYSLSLGNTFSAIKVTPTAAQTGTVIQARVNGGAYSAVTSGRASGDLALAEGVNNVEVTASSPDGTTSNTYAIAVTRSTAAADANLNALVLSSGSFSPAFTSWTTSYTASVVNATNTVRVTPTAAQAAATIRVRANADAFTTVSSGTASAALPLNVGSNPVQVEVTAPDGSTVKTYTVTITRAPSSNANLSALSLSSGAFSPAFSAATTSYTASVPFETTSITAIPTAEQANATIQARVNSASYVAVASGTASAALPLNVGSNSVQVRVTAQNGTTIKTYTVTVTRAKSPPPVTWTNPAPITYGAPLSAVQLNATSSLAGTFTYSPTNGTVLNAGTNTLSAIFAAVDTTNYVSPWTNTVNLVVNKAPPPVTWTNPAPITYGAPLSAVQLNATSSLAGTFTYSPANGTVLNAGTNTLSAIFSPSNTTNYVSPWTNTVNLVVNKAPPPVAWTNPAPIGAGTPLSAAQLNATSSVAGTFSYDPTNGTVLPTGTNTLLAIFSATDTTNYVSPVTNTVSIVVLGNNAGLGSLSLSSGTLSPSFDNAVTAYTATVTTTTIRVTPTVVQNGATVQARVNGGAYATVASGTASSPLSLNLGSNTVDVRVTAADGVTTKTYSIAVSRATPNPDLSSLTLSSGTLSPAFASATTSYAASVGYGTSSITVTPTVAQSGATVRARVNSGSYAGVSSGTASASLPLVVGSNTVQVEVTASDGSTIKTYTVTVTRAAAGTNSSLSSLSFTGGTLSPSFAASTTSYSTSVTGSSVTVYAGAADINATVQVKVNSGSFTAGSYGSANEALPLTLGSNTVTVKVTGENGTSITTYTITVTRVTGTNPDLSALVLSSGTLSPVFASATTSYTARVETNSITVRPTAFQLDSKVEVQVNSGSFATVASGVASASLPLNVGSNTVTVRVTAENGTSIKTYSVTITRVISTNADLAGLVVSNGALDFAAGTTNYVLRVGNATTSFTVTPTAAHGAATIQVRVNGGSYATVSSGAASASLPLNVGTNSVDIRVTAEDGTTAKIYTVNVARLPSGGSAQQFDSSGGITIPSLGNATPYPSTISVSGVSAATKLTVKINGFTHTYPSDVDVFLVAPGGQVCSLLSDAGSSVDVDGLNITFDDSAASSAPDSALGSGSVFYRPTDLKPGEALPPGATGAIGTSLQALLSVSLNGDWKLFVVDDAGSDSGFITSWSLCFDNGGAAFFDNSSYVDTANLVSSESDNVQAILADAGHAMSTFTGISSSSLIAALTGRQVLVIPDLENGDLATAMNAAACAVIRDFVSSGGGLLIHGQFDALDKSLLNKIFGFSLVAGSNVKTGAVTISKSNATGTQFAAGPATLTENDGIFMVKTSSLPAGSRAIYTHNNVADNSAVARVPYGSGAIVMVGFDGHNAAPRGAQDGGWRQTIDLAMREAAAAAVPTGAELSSLGLSVGALNPLFAPWTTSYTASVSNLTASIAVLPTAAQAGATIEARVNGGPYSSVASGTASAALPLNVGSNTVDVRVTASNSTTTKVYTVAVTRGVASNNANLNSLALSSGTLSPTFATNTTNYTASVAFVANSITVSPAPAQADATMQVRVNGGSYSAVANGSASASLPLNVGSNTVDVRVTAQDGSTTLTYTVTVTRAAAGTNPDLSALTLSSGTLSPTFAAGTTNYTAGVLFEASSVTVTPTAAQTGATIQARVNAGTYASVISGTASASLPLNVGSNTVDVRVTAQDGATIKTYTVTVTRGAASSEAKLSALALSSGTLSPVFAATTTSYTASVAYPTASILVTPTAAGLGAAIQVRVNGGIYALVPSGTASTSLPLNVGSNSVEAKVTAQDGSTTMTYTVMVTRAAAGTNPNLSALTLSSGTLVPAFSQATTNYTANIPAGINTLTVTPTAAQTGAIIQVRVNGGSYSTVASGTASGALPLLVGTNTVDVKCTAEDGTSNKTYTVAANASKSPPVITWSNPVAIAYGTPLSATQLNASSSVAGTFTYTPTNGTILNVGTNTLTAVFNATDTTNYVSPVTNTVSLVVNKAIPAITWSNPAAITYGTALSATQLNASSSVAGSFTYTPANGTILNAGTATLTNVFNATDTTNYVSPVTNTVSLVVNKATPTITWNNPAAITYGTPLSSTQLNATSSLPGVFLYDPTNGTVLNAGNYVLTATFRATDTNNVVSSITNTVNLVVNKATPPVTWTNPAAITYGTALSSTQLNATSSVAGSFTYTPASGTVLTAGTRTLTNVFNATDTTNYVSPVTNTVSLLVNKAAPAITWSNPAAITYGTALSSTQLNATSSVAGSFTYTPASGTVLPAGTSTLTNVFNATDTTNYVSPLTNTVSLVVNKAAATVSLGGLAQTYTGTARSVTVTTTPSGLSNAVTYDGLADAPTNAGSYSVVATVTDSNYTGSASNTLVVSKATATVTWTNPAAITYGTALSSTQLNATSSVAGSFTYTPAIGAVLNAGTNPLAAVFAANDTTNYVASVTNTVNLVVNKATPVITWNTPAPISAGTVLSTTQFNASSSVAGSFAYSPVIGTVLGAGTNTLSAVFTAADAANYVSPLTNTVSLVVLSSGSSFSEWSSNAPVTPAMVSKYAFGGASNNTAASELPALTLSNGRLSIAVIVRTNDSNLIITPQTASDLASWSSSGISMTPSTDNTAPVPQGWQRRVYSIDLTNQPSKTFMRFKATLNAQ